MTTPNGTPAGHTAITGHRPNRITTTREHLAETLTRIYHTIGATTIHQGMAPGADLTAAVAAHKAGIPHHAHIPWAGHRNTIPEDWLPTYDWATRTAQTTHTLNPQTEFPGNTTYYHRNKHLIENANTLIAIWDGKGGRTGTSMTVTLARQAGLHIYHITPDGTPQGWITNHTIR